MQVLMRLTRNESQSRERESERQAINPPVRRCMRLSEYDSLKLAANLVQPLAALVSYW